MTRKHLHDPLVVAVAAFFLCIAGARSARADCTSRNLLANLQPSEATGVLRSAVLTDGQIPLPGSPYDGEHSALFTGKHPEATFDLGEERTIHAVFFQADNNDSYLISISDDGKTFKPAFIGPTAPNAGMQSRIGQGFEWHTRFVRIQPKEGDGKYAVSELGLYCKKPDPFPPALRVVATIPKDPLGERVRLVDSWKGALALAVLPLLFAMGTLRRRPRIAVGVALVLLGFFGWTRFGRFHEDRIIHPWDAFHYFVGSKYFGELGYTQMYNCLAQHEREMGRAQPILDGQIRDLATNDLHDGKWMLTPAGRCRAHFTPARKKQFDADLEAFRPLFPKRLPFWRMVVDHGYNATPPLTAFLKVFTQFTPASKPALLAIACLDVLAYLGAFAVLWWGFGPRVAAIAALVTGFGEPWSYLWTGGSVGRAVWLFFLCAGLALLARQRKVLGAVSLTISGLLRLFPGVFVGALGLFVLVRAYRERTFTVVHKRVLVAIFGTLIAGVLVGGVVAGFDAYPAFYRDMQNHTSLAMGNQIGFESLVSFVPGARTATTSDNRLSDPNEVLKALQRTARHDRWPLWALAMGASLILLMVYSYRREARAWTAVVLAAPLLYASIVLSNYDYVWLMILAPIVATSRFRTAWLMSFITLTQITGLYIQDVEIKHTVLSFFTGIMLAVLVGHYWRTSVSDPKADAAALEAERAF